MRPNGLPPSHSPTIGRYTVMYGLNEAMNAKRLALTFNHY